MTSLIADGGSTKTLWAVKSADGLSSVAVTRGINPVHQSLQEISAIVREELLPRLTVAPQAVEFYGAGCRGAACDVVRRAVVAVLGLRAEAVTVDSDIVGAARALFGRSSGIACILGTGSNSALYVDGHVEGNVPPLGYILGDEGSGAALGKLLLNALFREQLGRAVTREFYEWYGRREPTATDVYAHIIDRVYRQPEANRFLASLSLFVGERVGRDSALRRLVTDNFRAFFGRCVDAYGRHDLAVGAVGSIAWFYRDLFVEVAAERGYRVGAVLRSPLSV